MPPPRGRLEALGARHTEHCRLLGQLLDPEQVATVRALDRQAEAMRQLGSAACVIDVRVARTLLRMLEQVVSPSGTGVRASIPGYRVAGKTGTAWKFAAGGYSEDKYISIFAGLAPASNPRLAAVVVIDEPNGELYYGSDVAAPVFANVISESLRLLAVAPDALPARDPNSIMQAMSR